MVGAEETCFYVHEWIITASSEFFKSAVKKEWTRSENREIDLRDESPAEFKIYVHWLYSGNTVVEAWLKARDLEKDGPDFNPLAKLYVLGERLNDATFQDHIINAILFLSRREDERGKTWCPTDAVANTIYAGTPNNSPARRLMVDFFADYGDHDWIYDESEEINHEFLTDLSKTLLGRRWRVMRGEEEEVAIDDAEPCKYHNHHEDQPCNSDMV